MKCPDCQFDNREGVKFCEECGVELELKCPNCKAKLPLGRKFCGDCGLKLTEPSEIPSIDYSEPQSYTPKFIADKILTSRSTIEGERKLVTVLFADVANYTAMSEKLDPEEVHQIMDGCFKILMDEIHKDEGTINQFTGDGVMALFGAPVAHEDHAQRACHAALSIQKAMVEYSDKVKKDTGAEFNLRIGLNSGPVIVGAIGNDLRMDYTAVGDTTNLASRLESMAEPGTIFVSENSHRLVSDFFEFVVLGKVEIKGKGAPQEIFELIEAGEVGTRIGASVAKGLTRFVGRKKSMAALMDAFDRVKAGSGQVVGLVGEAGVGKSRLLLEMRKSLAQGEFNYLEGRCLHFGGSIAYLPIIDILKFYFEIKEDDQEFVIKKKIDEKIFDLDDKFSDVIPPFQELLSLKVDDEDFIKLEPKDKRDRTFEALRNLMLRGSEIKPLVIAVEDVHWIDKTSEAFINYVIDWLAYAHILLILLYRPQYTHQWGSKTYYHKIGLNQLGTRFSAELVKAILEGGEVDPELRQLILNKATGNPLFLEEFTHNLLENSFIEIKDEKYVLIKKASDIQVPDTIQGIIAARMDRLEDNLKRTMQVASVIGRNFPVRILQKITGMGDELKSYLLNLQGLEFIYEKRLFPELEYIFKHALTQEVAYKSLLKNRKKEIHEKIGRAIEELYPERLEDYYEMLAYHFARSNNKEKAIEYLELANFKAANRNAMEEAKEYFDHAIKIHGTLPSTINNKIKRISLLVKQNWVFEFLFKKHEYYEILIKHEEMAKSLGNSNLLGIFYSRLANCHMWFGHLDKAKITCSNAIKILKQSEKNIETWLPYGTLQWVNLYQGNYDEVINIDEDILSSMKKYDPEIYTRSLATIIWAYANCGNWDTASEEGNKALIFAQETSNNSRVAFIACIISLAYNMKRDVKKAIEFAELAIKKATTIADNVWAKSTLAWALMRTEEPLKGVELVNPFISMYQVAGLVGAELQAKIVISEGYLKVQKYSEAEQFAKEGLDIAKKCGMKYFIGWANRLLGEIAMQFDENAAEHFFEEGITILHDIKAMNELALAYVGYGKLYKKKRMVNKANEYLIKALDIFEKLGTLIEPDKVRKELDE